MTAPLQTSSEHHDFVAVTGDEVDQSGDQQSANPAKRDVQSTLLKRKIPGQEGYESCSWHRRETWRQPSPKLLWQFRKQATLETRPPKQQHSLSELTVQWRERATRILGEDAPTWAAAVVAEFEADPMLRADDILLEELQQVAEVVVARVGDRRALRLTPPELASGPPVF